MLEDGPTGGSAPPIVVFAPVAGGIGASGAWCTSTVVFAPFARGIGARGACCTSTVVFAPIARGTGASGAWRTSTVVFAPMGRGIGASGACCTSTVVYAPLADGDRGVWRVMHVRVKSRSLERSGPGGWHRSLRRRQSARGSMPSWRSRIKLSSTAVKPASFPSLTSKM
jgi:hypothetical protein